MDGRGPEPAGDNELEIPADFYAGKYDFRQAWEYAFRGGPMADNLWTSPVQNLKPLKEMPLNYLSIAGTQATDFYPLQGMELTKIEFASQNISEGLDILSNIKSLEAIGTNKQNLNWPAGEFGDRFDMGEIGRLGRNRLPRN